MIKDLVAFKLFNLSVFSLLIYFASFAVPTGALVSILSFSSIVVGWFEIGVIFSLVFVAAVLGDISTYFFAKLFSAKVQKFISSRSALQKTEKKIEKFFVKNGFATIFFSRFLLTSLGPMVNYYCGFTKYDIRKFIGATLLGELFYAGLYTALGVIFRDFISDILNLINGVVIAMILVIAIIMVFRKIRKIMKSKKQL